MAREPSYPDDAPVAPGAGAGAPVPEEKKPASARTKHLVTGAAIGIGSAALVAALLYANRSRKRK
ncbi:MAG TPA: hypothetical protein VGW40_15275 [Allosphingosinicella sp.]|nr:hypothetical protein [Allosphingosinicella sp.]